MKGRKKQSGHFHIYPPNIDLQKWNPGFVQGIDFSRDILVIISAFERLSLLLKAGFQLHKLRRKVGGLVSPIAPIYKTISIVVQIKIGGLAIADLRSQG